MTMIRVQEASRLKDLLASAIDTTTQGVFAIALDDDRATLLSVTPDSAVTFGGIRATPQDLLYLTGISTPSIRGALSDFEQLVSTPTTRERELQEFFERYPEFLKSDVYAEATPQIVLERRGAGPLIPDFALRPANPRALCDLADLKLPSAKIVVGTENRRRLASSVLQALGQLAEYRDYFEQQVNREFARRTYGLEFFRPRMIVVIGRRQEYSPIEFRRAESEVPQLTITTYDDLLERARLRYGAIA